MHVLILVFVWVSPLLLLSSTSMSSTVLTAVLVTSTQTHQLLRERATKCYENCCDEECSLADVDGRAGIFFPYKCCFLARGGCTKRVLVELTSAILCWSGLRRRWFKQDQNVACRWTCARTARPSRNLASTRGDGKCHV